MRIAPGTFDLGMQIFEELPSAGFHGGSAGEQRCFEELFTFVKEGGVVARKIHESLEREGADNGAAIVEVAGQSGGGAFSFGWCKCQARNHLCEVPAKFDLVDLS